MTTFILVTVCLVALGAALRLYELASGDIIQRTPGPIAVAVVVDIIFIVWGVVLLL